MTKRVLDIGNCGLDHGSIEHMIQTNYDAEVDAARAASDALSLLGQQAYDLVLINRLLDIDGSPGMDVLSLVREQNADVPVMLITNFPEYQQAAIDAGAVPGFGKSSIGTAETIELLSTYLK